VVVKMSVAGLRLANFRVVSDFPIMP